MESLLTSRSIIVRLPNWLGDAVMATAVLSALREQWPKAQITAMISEGLAPLLEKDPRIDELLRFKRSRGFFRRFEERQIVQRLQEGHYDLGILLTGSFSSAWWFYRASIPRRAGFAVHARRWLLTDPVPLPENYKKQHLVKSYLQIVEHLGVPKKERAPKLYISATEKEQADQVMKAFKASGGSFVIGINPTAAFGPAKCWPQERFRELARELLNEPLVTLVFFAEKASHAYVEEIIKGLSARAINMAGRTTLRELMALMASCNLFITNDSGPMHLASALSVPLIALFGSTSDEMTGPYGGGTVIHKRVGCSPCFLRECPLDFRCMKAITVADVLKEVRAFL